MDDDERRIKAGWLQKWKESYGNGGEKKEKIKYKHVEEGFNGKGHKSLFIPKWNGASKEDRGLCRLEQKYIALNKYSL